MAPGVLSPKRNLMRHLLGFLALSIATATVLTPAVALADKTRVLGLKIEGEGLEARDKADLFAVTQRKLAALGSVELVQTPNIDITDLMIDLECVDIDVECLTKLGKKFRADRVIYAQVDAKEGAYRLVFKAVDVGSGKALHERTIAVAAKVGLSDVLGKQLDAVFGKPAPVAPKTGKLVVDTGVAGAKIFIDNTFAGTTRVELDKAPGKYRIRVTKDGFEESVRDAMVVVGKTTTSKPTLEAVATPPEVKDPIKDPIGGKKKDEAGPEFYETWWFWTIIGGVVAVGATVAIVLALTGEDDVTAPTGNVAITVNSLP